MATYKELTAQMADLQAKLAEARKNEVAQVVERIKADIAEFGLTASDLGFKSAGRGAGRAAVVRRVRPPKFRDPKSGAEWNGLGKPPAWIRDAKNRSRFLIQVESDHGAKSPVGRQRGKRGARTAEAAEA
ncbi:H-NS histone family protein (plasmid) [Burkholderia sp. MBR-1]|nr:H-NS histone family protein [Burkholderia sp. MBR-1]